MELESFIRETISAYLDGGSTLATELALLATGYLAGYQAGDRTEDDLRAALLTLIMDTADG